MITHVESTLFPDIICIKVKGVGKIFYYDKVTKTLSYGYGHQNVNTSRVEKMLIQFCRKNFN